ncbi:D-alanyl-D-alanine carboxypeptidase [Streptomyces sp. NPDC005900]|uniref:D-alanyl-D-alanine carboxypeptidase n=1 Tax=Streptomyces sp. NPDC005900 TaxID=3154569 RepID=UPI0033DEBDEE
MAGETPDRSKQRKSSGNPTAADPSAPAPEERDPRLAITREIPAARADAGETSEASETSDASETSQAAASGGGANGDARLRKAVAAWVATSDEDEDADAAGAGSGDGPADPGAESPSAQGDSDEDTASAESDAAKAAEAGGAAKVAASAKSAAEDTTSGKGDAARSGTGEAAASAESGGEESGSAKGDRAPGKSGAAATAAASADSGREESGSGKGDAVSAASGAAKAPAWAKSDRAEGDDASVTSDADKAAEAGDAAKAAASAKAAAEGSTSGKGDTGDEAEGAGSTGVDQATAVFRAPTVKPEVDQPTTMLKLGGDAPAKGAAKSPAKDSAKASAKGDAKASAKGSAKGGAQDSAEADPTAERDAERTSKFVALKPLDERSAKPAAAASKPAATAAEADATQAPPPVERTTQQPVPPKPPLDLLAELTNTPPPPETPTRTAVRRLKIWTPLVLLLVVVFAVVQAVRPLPAPTLDLTAQQSVTFEGGKPSVPWPAEGQAAMDVNGIGTFGTSGEQKPVPIASIAKVMTVYLILRDHPLKKGEDGPKIPVDAAAQKHYETGKAEQESVVKVTEGQKISEYEALQAVMLPSANNVAKLLARWDTKSHSEDEFVAKMNKTAKELGMKNTRYTDPSGLDKTTVSTAEDLVKLGRAAMENPVFNEISRQPSYKDLNGDKQNNFFGLVPTVAIGIKTGTTTAAGGNILFAAEKKVGGETQTIIGAALGQFGKDGVANIDAVTGVTRKLIEAGQEALTAKTIVKKGDVVGRVDDGLGGTTPVVASENVSAVGWSGLTVKLRLEQLKGKAVPHTAKAGTKVGVLSVGDGKGEAVEVPVALQKDLAEPGLGAKLKRVG